MYRRKFSLPAGWLAAGGDGAGGVDGLLNENFQLVEVTGVGWSGFGTRVRGGPNLRNGIFEVNLAICEEARAFFFVNIIGTDRAAPLRHYKLRLTWQWCGLLYILGNIALAGGVVVAFTSLEAFIRFTCDFTIDASVEALSPAYVTACMLPDCNMCDTIHA